MGTAITDDIHGNSAGFEMVLEDTHSEKV